MIIRKLLSVCAAAIYLTALPVQADAGQWIRTESQHFVIYSDTGTKTASLYASRLEQYRYILSRFHGLTAQDDADAPKLKIYSVDSFTDLKHIWPGASDNVAGFYKTCADDQAAVAIYQNDSIQKKQDARNQAENPSQAVLFHEYAHNFMFQYSGVAYPHWYVEGYAEYFSTARIENDTAVIGMAFSWRVPRLTSYTGDQLSWEDLLRDNWRSQHYDPGKAGAFYAQSWLLAHYVMSDPARTAQMSQYIAAYGRGEDPVKAFEAAFDIPVKDLGKVLGDYFSHLHATEYHLKDMPAPQVTTTLLPASANRLLLLDTATQLCSWKKDRPGLLERISAEATKYSGDDYAQMVLASAEIVNGDEAKAVPYLQTYTTAHPDDAQGWFRLGQALYLMTQHKHIADGETVDTQAREARAALGKAYQLDPLDAPNLYYYAHAQADVPGTIGENAVTAAIAAHDLAPSVKAYAFYAARLLIDRNRLDEASIVLIPLADNPHAQETADRARKLIDAIKAGKPKNEILALLQSSGEDDAP